MSTKGECLVALDRAVDALAEFPDPGLADESRALATMIRGFRSHVAQTVAPPLSQPFASEQERKTSSGLRNWTAAELERIALRPRFAPRTFGTVEGRRKWFHTPTCFRVRYDSRGIDLETALKEGYKPCEDCGGVRFGLNPAELASMLEELLYYVEEIHRFELGDFFGTISLYEAARILGLDSGKLEKECRQAAQEQLRGVIGDRYFQIRGKEINVLRCREDPAARRYSFRFQRPDCVAYARKWGRMAVWQYRG
jgi:hypothetical protein